MSTPWAVNVISDIRLPPAFCEFISGGRREPGDEVSIIAHVHIEVALSLSSEV